MGDIRSVGHETQFSIGLRMRQHGRVSKSGLELLKGSGGRCRPLKFGVACQSEVKQCGNSGEGTNGRNSQGQGTCEAS